MTLTTAIPLNLIARSEVISPYMDDWAVRKLIVASKAVAQDSTDIDCLFAKDNLPYDN